MFEEDAGQEQEEFGPGENEHGIPSDVEALFRGEIPEDGGGESEGGDQEAGSQDQAEAQEEGSGEQPQDQGQQGQPEPDERDKTIQQLRDELARTQGYVSSLAQQQQAAQQQQGEQQSQEDNSQDELPGYDFNIPDNLVQGLQSDDPGQARQAIQYLLKGAGQSIHQQVREEFRQELSEAQKAAVRAAVNLSERQLGQREQQAQQQQQARSVFQDYYNAFPEHNDPYLRPVIREIARSTAQEMGKSGWDQQLRDAIGQRVEQYRARLAGQGQKQSQPQQPPHQTSQGTRPAGSAGGQSEESLITETLMAGFE